MNQPRSDRESSAARCAHAGCGCEADRTTGFCSAYCAAAGGRPGAGCECGHPPCHATD